MVPVKGRAETRSFVTPDPTIVEIQLFASGYVSPQHLFPLAF